MIRRILLSLLTGSLLLACGCDFGSSTPESAGVQLTVNFEGVPLQDARVVLLPVKIYDEQGTVIPLATGLTDEAGKCELSTSGKREIRAGRYRVIVSKPLPARQAKRQFFAATQMIRGNQESAMFESEQDLLPMSYNSHSQLEVVVEPGLEKTKLTLDLQSRCP